jgi:Ca2+/Na+ antiporter
MVVELIALATMVTVAVVVGGFIAMAIIVMASALIALRFETPAEQFAMFWTSCFIMTGLVCTAGAVLFLMMKEPGMAVLLAGCAGFAFYNAWKAWNGRPPRRKVQRVLGVVRDIGGRLGIIPT